MLLAIDCGNTNTVFSIWDGDNLLLPGELQLSIKGQRISIMFGSHLLCN